MRRILCIFLIILILSACANRSVVKLIPVPPSSTWYMGKNILTSTQDSITANIAFDTIGRKHTVFLVEIINHSNNTVLVDPAKFYFAQYHLLKSAQNASPGDVSNKVLATDPEPVILQTEIDIAEENAQYAEGELLDAAVGLLGFIHALAHLGEGKTPEEREEEKERREDEEREDEHHAEQINYLNRKLDTWKNTALRLTTLEPNQSIYGKVFFPRCLKKGYLVFHFPVGISDLTFVYKKELLYP